MKFSILAENVNKKLPFIAHAVSSRSQLTSLLNFLISVKDKELIISATDLEIGISGKIPANIDEEGETTVPAKTLLELFSNIQKGKVDISTDGETLQLKTQTIKTQMQTQSAKDFPTLYEEKGEEWMTFDKAQLEKDMRMVVFAASQDSGRPALSGVFFGGKDKEKTVVATDGYRLSLKKIPASAKKEAGEEKKKILIPSRLIRELVSLKEEGEVHLFVSEGKNQVVFSQGDTDLVGRLIEAEFPDYEKIIPADFSTRAVFGKKEMQDAVKTCWVFAKETSGIVKFSIGKNKITVSASTPSVGQGSVDVEAKVEGEENEIAFNGRYVMELFSNIDEEMVAFEMAGPLNAGVFKIENDNTFLHLIMPIRVQE